jgi:hypothetical protein
LTDQIGSERLPVAGYHGVIAWKLRIKISEYTFPGSFFQRLPLIPPVALCCDGPKLLAHRPAAPLASYVEKLWYCDGYQGVLRKERVLPIGKFQLVISLAERPLRAPGSPTQEWGQLAPSLVLGIRSHYSVIHTAVLQSAMGVVFWPGGARVFFDSPADAFYNESVPLDLLWGSKASELRDLLRTASTAVKKFRVLETALSGAGEAGIRIAPQLITR